MPARAAERRGQSTVEYVAVIALVATAIGGALLLARTSLPTLITTALGRTPPTAPDPSPAARATLEAALVGDPDALTLLGARARIAEEVGTAAADRILAETVRSHLERRHGEALARVTLSEPIGSAGHLVASTTGRPRLRLVSPADEAYASLVDHRPEDRDRAAAEAVAWSTASTILNGLRRNLGTGVGALRLLLTATATDDPLPPGSRAGDLVVCLPVDIRLTQRPAVRAGWRIVVLRRDRIVDDRIAPTPAHCSGSADSVLPTDPERT